MPAFDNSPPSPAASSASDGSTNSVSTGPPRTPVSAAPPPLVMPTFMNFTGEDTINGVPSLGGAKRSSKTTRRVNTAERRATHNAVERQRRETLNGRFLDLAALLSNLNQIRRPSKSAIVNSSIAHLNASRRHRILAAQQLRMMKNEADALRHEVNEWRARAGVATFVEDPIRSDAFGIVLRGELEFEAGDMLEGDSGEDEEHDGPYGAPQYSAEPVDEYALQRQQQEHAEMLAAQAQLQQHAAYAHVHPSAAHAVPIQGYPVPPSSAHYYTSSPTIAGPALAAFDNPAMGAESLTQAELWAQQQMLHAHHRQQQRQATW
ncbi:BHLH domain-containing protein [Mycena venus]|uniref:BHLH domain-containing protein n=1 Tax=Mycena venus TaxID=2733690 RepID=A0A8H7D1U3_9AGAR|nr:BHLH domain-containing protein [Mycena venus]